MKAIFDNTGVVQVEQQNKSKALKALRQKAIRILEAKKRKANHPKVNKEKAKLP